jgi:hypothetical protein
MNWLTNGRHVRGVAATLLVSYLCQSSVNIGYLSLIITHYHLGAFAVDVVTVM